MSEEANELNRMITALGTATSALHQARRRLVIAEERMMACNVQSVRLGEAPVHELVGDLTAWAIEIDTALQQIEENREMSEQEVQWGEWEDADGDIIRCAIDDPEDYEYATAEVLNEQALRITALEREVRDLRAKAALADEVEPFVLYARVKSVIPEFQGEADDWMRRLRALPSTSEGEGK